MSFRKDELINKIIDLGIELDENIKWDNTKLIKKLGDYTLSKIDKVSWGKKFMQSMETVQLCKHLKDEIKNFDISPLESEDYVAEFKINGMRCLDGTSVLLCSDGIERTIKDIVDNKLPVEVLSYNEATQQNEFKPITMWMHNGKKVRSQWVIVGNMPNTLKNLKVTKDHKIFTKNRGYIEAQYITKDDEMLFSYLGCNNSQKQVLLGSFLGDGYISVEKRSPYNYKYRLVMSHGSKQLEYLKLKNNTFGVFSRPIKSYTSGYGSTCYKTATKPLWDINKYITNNSQSHKSHITRDILEELDWLGWAIWYLDDGNLNANRDMNIKISNKVCRASLALCRYSDEECLLVQEFLKDKFGLGSSIVKSKGVYNILTIDTESSPKFFENIAKYVPKCMNYKLPPEFRDVEKVAWWEDTKLVHNSVFIKGVTVREHPHSDPKIERLAAGKDCYDIEVEGNHNFYANNILVHNCIILYDPEESFSFFSRKESVETFLNTEFTKKIYLIKDGIVKEPQDFKNKFPLRFALDCEITVDGDTEFEGQSYENMEDYLQAVLGSLPARAKDFQLNGHKLKFTIFDVLYFEKNPSGPPPEYKFEYDDKELTNEDIKWVEHHFERFLLACGHKSKKSKAIPKLLYK